MGIYDDNKLVNPLLGGGIGSALWALSQPPSIPYKGTLITWRGLSGITRDFQLYPIGTQFFDIGGVYIFCRQAPNGNWDAVYIGQTSSFKRRLSDQLEAHHRIGAIRLQAATHICTWPIADQSLRIDVETDLRHFIKTPCNDQ